MPSAKKSPRTKPTRRNPRDKSTGSKSLKRYVEKRDLSKTPEPAGDSRPKASAKTKTQLAFCIQKHLATALHYDFRLEHPATGTLLSWAVPKGPSVNPRDKRLAMRVEDHPYDYKDFEGVIPSGYGAGVVMLWDTGTWQPEPGFENVSAALQKGELKFTLTGTKLKGSWVLVRTGPASPTGERERWLLIKHRDATAGELDIATAAPNSVKSDLTFEGILKRHPDVWESHKGGNAPAEVEKIVQKVLALNEPSAAPSHSARRRSPRVRK